MGGPEGCTNVSPFGCPDRRLTSGSARRLTDGLCCCAEGWPHGSPLGCSDGSPVGWPEGSPVGWPEDSPGGCLDGSPVSASGLARWLTSGLIWGLARWLLCSVQKAHQCRTVTRRLARGWETKWCWRRSTLCRWKVGSARVLELDKAVRHHARIDAVHWTLFLPIPGRIETRDVGRWKDDPFTATSTSIISLHPATVLLVCRKAADLELEVEGNFKMLWVSSSRRQSSVQSSDVEAWLW